jgi:acyl-coenzyme A thioesterase PaaI-like protein
MNTDLPRALAERIADATSVFPEGAPLAQARAADALRRLGEAVVDPDFDCATEVVAELERLAAMVSPARSRFRGRPARGQRATFPMGTHPVLGPGSPLAVPIDVDRVGELLVAWATYGPMHEGLPGSVFGGHIAAAFDALLGIRAALVGTPCAAAELTTTFRGAVPLGVEVRYEAELIGVDDRKIRVRGQCFDDEGSLCAEAHALFIAVSTAAVTSDHVSTEATSR